MTVKKTLFKLADNPNTTYLVSHLNRVNVLIVRMIGRTISICVQILFGMIVTISQHMIDDIIEWTVTVHPMMIMIIHSYRTCVTRRYNNIKIKNY